MKNFGDYIVYVDESGDHGIHAVNSNYPMFVLAFCIFNKSEYTKIAVPKIQELKFQYWGHDMVVLHEREIRKAEGDFSFLTDSKIRPKFIEDINRLVCDIPFTLVASAIHKGRLKENFGDLFNPYHVALGAGLRKVEDFLRSKEQQGVTTHVVLEKRGKKEDLEIELEFRRICDGENYDRRPLPFIGRFASKPANSCGLQFADMVARPIGRHLLNPMQDNRAFNILKSKIYTTESDVDGKPTGLIHFS